MNKYIAMIAIIAGLVLLGLSLRMDATIRTGAGLDSPCQTIDTESRFYMGEDAQNCYYTNMDTDEFYSEVK